VIEQDVIQNKTPLMGALKPRLHTPWVGGNSRVNEIIELAENIGQPLLDWQKLILTDMCAVDEKNMFHKKSATFICARQSGKSHMMRMRVLAGLFCFDEQNILIMSSQRQMASKSLEMIADIIERNDFLLARVKGGTIDKAYRRTNGNERIILETGAEVKVVAATIDSSRGLTADMVWIDELRDVGVEALDASKSTTLTRPNSQRFYTSNAGHKLSTVLNEIRERSLNKPPKTVGYYEYSAPDNCDIWDRSAWAAANPSLGTLISESAIEEIISTSTYAAAMTETLCKWVGTDTSPWTPNSWTECADPTLVMSPGMYSMFAFDIEPHARRHAALVAGAILPDGRIGLSLVKTWESDRAIDELKIAVDIKDYCNQWMPKLVIFDKYTGQAVADRLHSSGVKVSDCSGTMFYTACSTFKDAIDNKRVVHGDQPVLNESMDNVAAKSNDSAWRIIRKKSSGSVAAPIGMAMLALHLTKPVSEAKVYS
jgi:phage terminase large subunit-like protein